MKLSGDAEDAPNARSRWRVSMRETDVLEAVFASSPRPNKATIQQLATMLDVKPRQVQVWFQNRRQRWRKDFLELERTRDVHLVGISGKVLDFQSDLLSAGADSMPAGWEHLLGTPGAAALVSTADVDATSSITSAPTVAPPGGLAVRATRPSSAGSLSAAEPGGARASKEEALHMGSEEVDALNEIDLCDLLSFTPMVAPLPIQPPQLDGTHNSSLLSLNCMPTPTPTPTPRAVASESDGDDTIWVGMEWLVPEPTTS